MSGKAQELYEAATALLPFLEASTDPSDYLNKALQHKDETQAQRLRRQADEIEAKDAAIHRFRAAAVAFEEGRE
jgi:hypothetical protein